VEKHNFHRPVIQVYRERLDHPEKEALIVIKSATGMTIEEGGTPRFSGEIKDFFPLMGRLDFLSDEAGLEDSYVLCWFDDREEDFGRSWKRLTGVRFAERPALISSPESKPAYSVSFTAAGGRL
jgi:hypothetical protein